MFPVNKWWLGVVCLITLFAFPHSIEAQDRTIVLSGTVVTPKEILNKGWIVIKQGKISAILKEVPREENAIWVNTNDIILPGFIDLHNHPLYSVFERWTPEKKFGNRYEWRSFDKYKNAVGTPGAELQRQEESYCDLFNLPKCRR